MLLQLLKAEFGPPLHSMVIPGEMHHIEEEVVRTFQLPGVEWPAPAVGGEAERTAAVGSAGSGEQPVELQSDAIATAVARCGVRSSRPRPFHGTSNNGSSPPVSRSQQHWRR